MSNSAITSTDRHPRRSNRTSLAALLALACALCAMPSAAVESAKPPAADVQQSPAPAAKELLSINMRDADIGAVIQWIAEKTHKQIVIDPRVHGKVTVMANEPMTVDQAYQVFLAALDVYGFAATEHDGVLRIFPAAMARTSPAEILQSYQQPRGGEQAVYVFHARNVSATSLKNLIQPLVPATGYLEVFTDNNSLVIGDNAANVKRLLNLVRQIDSSGDFNMQSIKLQHAAADKVAALVTSLVGKKDGSNFAVVGDPRSNSLLMNGDPATRRRVQELVSQLDQPITALGSTRVVYLHYLDAKEVLPILQGLSAKLQKSDKDSQSAATPVSIEASDSTNAIVMSAPPDLLDQMEKVIKKIDIRRSQVLVEAIIVEVSQDFSKSLGVEWNNNLSRNNGAVAATNFGLKPAVTSTTDTSTIDSVSSLLSNGLNLGFFRKGSLRALIEAFASDGNTDILSTPSILTLDNQEAEILVGSNVPFITGQSTSAGSSTENPFTTIQRKDIGLTLKITPKINESHSITLDVNQEIESISDSTQVQSDIVTNKRSIKTKVLVDDGTILVLGGLISDEEQKVENKVPFFGDLPLIGRLFKSSTEKKVKKNLMVFIHPVIVDSGDETNDATREKYDYMKSLHEARDSGDISIKNQKLKEFDTYRPRSGDKDKQK